LIRNLSERQFRFFNRLVEGRCSMNAAARLILVLAATTQAKDASTPGQAAATKHERILAIYASDAAEYTIYRDSSRKERVELRRKPVLVCADPARGGGDGAVYVWTYRGRAEVFGTFFSFPTIGPRKLYHEFHSLSLSVLDVSRSGTHDSTWAPLAPGIELAPLTGAPRPAETAAQRLSQMRALTREFSASTRDRTERRLELRLLPQPLYRYESTDHDVLDGAVFAYVTSTDPEVLLVIEARKPAPAEGPVWSYAVCRFTDLGLSVRHKGKEVFTAPLIPYDAVRQDPQHRFRLFHDRDIPSIEETKAP
jgi:hypothetical protein